MGIPVAVEPLNPGAPEGGMGYRIPREQYYLRDPGLAADELAALHLAAATVRLEGTAGDEAMWKLGGALDAPAPVGAVAALPGSEHLADVFGAVTERRPLTFGYRGGSRTVDPWRIAFRNGHWYVNGFDHERQEERSFRLDRFDGPPTAGPPGAFERAEGRYRRRDLRGRWATTRSSPPTCSSTRPRPAGWSASSADAVVEQRSDGAVVVAVRVTNRDAFRTFVLGLLDHAEVLGPPALRDDIVVAPGSGATAGRQWARGRREPATRKRRSSAPPARAGALGGRARRSDGGGGVHAVRVHGAGPGRGPRAPVHVRPLPVHARHPHRGRHGGRPRLDPLRRRVLPPPPPHPGRGPGGGGRRRRRAGTVRAPTATARWPGGWPSWPPCSASTPTRWSRSSWARPRPKCSACSKRQPAPTARSRWSTTRSGATSGPTGSSIPTACSVLPASGTRPRTATGSTTAGCSGSTGCAGRRCSTPRSNRPPSRRPPWCSTLDPRTPSWCSSWRRQPPGSPSSTPTKGRRCCPAAGGGCGCGSASGRGSSASCSNWARRPRWWRVPRASARPPPPASSLVTAEEAGLSR